MRMEPDTTQVSPETQRTAERFAERMMLNQKGMPQPRILPSENGKVGIHWETERWELLMEIPPHPGVSAEFYGDDKGNTQIKGTLDIRFNHSVLLWWLNSL